MLNTTKAHYYRSCVEWPDDEIHTLHGLLDAPVSIEYSEFIKHVDVFELTLVAQSVGYKNLTELSADDYVAFYTSTLTGVPAYFMVHSAIEFVFVDGIEPNHIPTPNERRKLNFAATRKNLLGG